MSSRLRVIAAALGLALSAGFTATAASHDRHRHAEPAQKSVSPAPKLPAGLTPALPFPSKIGGDFELVDHFGKTRSLGDFSGKPLLVFFGYAECQAICSVALPRLADMVDILDARKIEVQPVLITVDPERDTPATMRIALPRYHKRLIGLTGSRTAIDKAQKAYQVESKVVYTEPDGSEIFAHGSYIYLMDGNGKFLTLLPPILGPERMADIAEKYL